MAACVHAINSSNFLSPPFSTTFTDVVTCWYKKVIWGCWLLFLHVSKTQCKKCHFLSTRMAHMTCLRNFVDWVSFQHLSSFEALTVKKLIFYAKARFILMDISLFTFEGVTFITCLGACLLYNSLMRINHIHFVNLVMQPGMSFEVNYINTLLSLR